MKRLLWKRCLAILMAALSAFIWGGWMPPAYAADQSEPNAIRDSYQVGGVTYVNVNSKSFDSNPKKFYEEMLTGRQKSVSAQSSTSVYDRMSAAERWMYLAVVLDKNSKDGTYENALNAVLRKNYQYPGYRIKSWDDAYMEPLHYLNYKGEDAFYMRLFSGKKDGSKGRRYYVLFKDFQVGTLLPDARVKGNYISTTMKEGNADSTYQSTAINDSNTPVKQTISSTESGSVTVSHTVKTSFSHSYKEGFKIGAGGPLGLLTLAGEFSFEATQTLSDEKSDTTSNTKTYSNTTTSERTIPPYSQALMETGKNDTTITTRYNCPVALTYTVEIMNNGTADWDLKNWREDKYTFGPDARADLYQRWSVEGSVGYNDPDNGYDKAGINWHNVEYDHNWDGQRIKEKICTVVPVSSAGAVLTQNIKSTYTKYKEIAPLYPLRYVKILPPKNVSVIGGKLSYDNVDYLHLTLPVGNSSNTKCFELQGYNDRDGEYSGFNKQYGYWIVTDAGGNELGDGAPIKMGGEGVETEFTAVKPGTCYLRYMIDEKSYPDDTAGQKNVYTTNKDLTQKTMMKVTVEGSENHNTLEIMDGDYIGYVGAEPERIGDHLIAGVFNESGKKIDAPYIWDAQLLPSDGINLTEDGMIFFTRPGKYKVRIMTPDRKQYSPWYEIRAEWNGEDSDLPEIVDDATYRIADEATVLLVDGDYKASANGEKVNLEDAGKLTVSAEDLTGDRHPIKYEWEQLGGSGNGLVLDKNGDAVFTKPGNYFVRVTSGEEHSGWVEIDCFEPAEIIWEPIGNDVFDYRDGALLASPGMATGGEMAYCAVRGDDRDVPPDNAYHTDLPAAAAEGTYNIWYKAAGDDTHGDSLAKCIEVTVARTDEQKAQEAAISAAKACKVTLKSVKAKKGNKAVVKWKKNASAEGYQLLYSTSKKFTKKTTKTVTIRKASTIKKTVGKLKKGKKYYFKIRPYQNLFDPATGAYQNFYGKWSKVKGVKAK